MLIVQFNNTPFHMRPPNGSIFRYMLSLLHLFLAVSREGGARLKEGEWAPGQVGRRGGQGAVWGEGIKRYF